MQYFKRQAGAGSRMEPDIGSVYASTPDQQGRGCCGVGRVLTAAAAPLITKGIRAVSEELSNAGYGLYRDYRRDPTPSAMTNAAVSRLAEAGENLKRRARRALTGRGAAKKRSTSKPKKMAGKKKKTSGGKIKKKATKKGIKRCPQSKRGQRGSGSLGLHTIPAVSHTEDDIFS